jgi:hypothetical protein
LIRGGVSDSERLAPQIQTALSLDEKHELYEWVLFARGLYDYRCGRFDEARTACRISRQQAASDFTVLHAMNQIVEAMASYRLGRSGEATKALAEADRLLDADGPQPAADDLGELWHDWLCCRILRREASEMIDRPVRMNAQK